MDDLKDVYILTNFSSYLKSFSPIIVVSEQIKMLKRNGYNPILIACEGWEPPNDTVFSEVETRLLPNANSHDPNHTVHNVDELVDALYGKLKDELPEDCFVITHDLIFLPDYTILNLASRQLARELAQTIIYKGNNPIEPKIVKQNAEYLIDLIDGNIKDYDIPFDQRVAQQKADILEDIERRKVKSQALAELKADPDVADGDIADLG